MTETQQPVEPLRKCWACEAEIPKAANRCGNCNATQQRIPCRTCGMLMPVFARRCNECNTFQDARRFFQFSSATPAAITVLISVLALVSTQYANYLNRESKTSISFTGADTRVIYVHVANSGRKPSMLRAYRLSFGKLPIEPERLVLLTGDSGDVKSLVPAGGEARIGLLVRGLTPGIKDAASKERYSAEEIQAMTSLEQVTLQIDVEESTGRVTRSVEFEAYQIERLIQNKLSNYGEE